ncbi:iron dicitrate transport regulator FecR [Terrimonas sp.]|uniref:FecR family protein n=1 Tax=Terrimonas sp. TaxID=1914338 RepID=UPI000D511CD2|nr:FecR family protein [Terrimonas sp.]PVD50673.1 iron dicitrate transport regulator FecR [Terrimonas sp.]
MPDKSYTQEMLILADKWLHGTITEEEKKVFTEWYNGFDDSFPLNDIEVPLALKQEMFASIQQKKDESRIKRAHFFPFRKMGWAAAVIIMLCCAAGLWIYNKPDRSFTQQTIQKSLPETDIAPGTNKATLTLADGSIISLDEAKKGSLAKQGNTAIVKLDSGQLAYHVKGAIKEISYNTLTTPRGGQFHLTLPDGSEVWLNAASSIRFPTAFEGKQRKVSITGEAYFEIKPDKSMPFIVQVNEHTSVEVLGTHFNINSYSDEPSIKTTLIEGLVKVNSLDRHEFITPGQQIQLNENNTIRLIKQADIEEALAWKNGVFQFREADLPSVLRQLSRWYDVDVQYEKDIPERVFEGEMQRDLSLLQVLKILEKNKVRFEIKGKILIVKK